MAVTDYSTTAGNNSTISGVNIAEGCSPAGINNAIRQMMADVRAFYDATPLIAGTPTVSGAWTIAGDWIFTGEPTWNDSVKAFWGTGKDGEIYFNGTDFVARAVAGKLLLRGDEVWALSGDGTETLFKGAVNGAFTAYYDNTARLATSATGVSVTGALSATTAAGAWFLDEDDFASDSASKIPSQQSTKAYVDARVSGTRTLTAYSSPTRTHSTAYQNTSLKDRDVYITGTASNISVRISPDNVTYSQIGILVATNLTVMITVPPGFWYKVDGPATINAWVELQ